MSSKAKPRAKAAKSKAKTSGSKKIKEPQVLRVDKSQYKMLNDWQHLDRRPDMYVGPMTTPDEGIELFVFTGSLPPKIQTKPKSIEDAKEPQDVEMADSRSHVSDLTGPTEQTGKTRRSVGKDKAARLAMGVKAVKLMCPLALLNIFEEITQNAIDKSIEDPTTKAIKVTIGTTEAGELEISVWNDGDGIPSYIHEEAGVPVPTMLFGMTKSSDKYDDTKKRKSGGRNGIGAKATNFFSKRLKVETYCAKMQTLFKQSFYTTKNEKGERVLKWKPHSITSPKRKGGYTKVTYVPDLERFGLKAVPENLVDVLRSKVWDIGACTKPSLSVHLDGQKLPLKGFSHYVSLFSSNPNLRTPLDSISDGDGNVVWNVGVLPIDPDGPPELKTGIDIGFVNGLRCCKGRHIEYARSKIAEAISKKLKLTSFKAHKTRTYCHVFVTISICNPSFDSQTKTTLESQLKEFGFKWEPSTAFVKAIGDAGILNHIATRSKVEEDTELLRKAASKTRVTRNSLMARSIVEIDKLRDAGNAGKKNSSCTLILAEGDSAIGSVEPGLEELGTDDFGLFPLKGKPLNTRKAVTEKNGLQNVTENEEIHNVMLALGLSFDKTYETRKEYDTLRYKRVWLMMDQDVDGSHICGLFYSFLHQFFPILVKKYHFVYRFATPLIRAVPQPSFARRLTMYEFFSHADFTRWLGEVDDETKGRYDILYLKGLATSDQEDMRRYMADYKSHIVRLRYTAAREDGHDPSSEAIQMFFLEEKVDERKEILSAYDPTLSVSYEAPVLAIEDFLLKDMIHYSMDSLYRSVPSAIDGLKESQRKVLYTALRKNVRKRVKVAQFASEVAAYTHYHHGEKSVEETVTKMAQEHPGSNNFNYLFPAGQFGSRSYPRKEHGQSRYIFTYLNPATLALFPKEDWPVTRRRVDEEHLVEPVTYFPVVPAILLNGSAGVGTGWSNDVYAYSPEEVIRVQEAYLDQEGAPDGSWKTMARGLKPWYAMHRGTMERRVDPKTGEELGYISRGAFSVQAFPKYVEVVIHELPHGTWTHPYLTKMKNDHQFDSTAKTAEAKAKAKSKGKKPPKAKPKFIIDEKNGSTNVKVHLTFYCAKDYMVKLMGFKSEEEMDGALGTPVDGYSFDAMVKTFKMQSSLSTRNMHAFDLERQPGDKEKLTLKHFSTLDKFFKVHGGVRLQAYVDRQAFTLKAWSHELLKLESQLRYLEENFAGTIDIKRKARAEAYRIFLEKGYPDDRAVAPPPHPSDRDLVVQLDTESEHESSDDEAPSTKANTFTYLLGLTHAFFTAERFAKLKKAIEDLKARMDSYAKLTPWDLWKKDLANLKEKYTAFAKEREARASKAKAGKRGHSMTTKTKTTKTKPTKRPKK
jgi:DNA topoisomerase-2